MKTQKPIILSAVFVTAILGCLRPYQFECKSDGKCIDIKQVCDTWDHCWDGSDEANCNKCPDGRNYGFLCHDGAQCVRKDSMCDGVEDCHDGSDEGTHCNLDMTCFRPDQMACTNPRLGIKSCVDRCSGSALDCVGQLNLYNCTISECLNRRRGNFLCKNRKCVSLEHRCDGYNDCDDYSDELNCSSDPPSYFACADSGMKIASNHVCDSMSQCADHSDELSSLCNTSGFWYCIENGRYTGYYHQRIRRHNVCNGGVDCENGADEKGCPGKENISTVPSRLSSESKIEPTSTTPTPNTSSPATTIGLPLIMTTDLMRRSYGHSKRTALSENYSFSSNTISSPQNYYFVKTGIDAKENSSAPANEHILKNNDTALHHLQTAQESLPPYHGNDSVSVIPNTSTKRPKKSKNRTSATVSDHQETEVNKTDVFGTNPGQREGIETKDRTLASGRKVDSFEMDSSFVVVVIVLIVSFLVSFCSVLLYWFYRHKSTRSSGIYTIKM